MNSRDLIRKRNHRRRPPELETEAIKGDPGGRQEKQDRARTPRPMEPRGLAVSQAPHRRTTVAGVSALRPPGPHLGTGHQTQGDPGPEGGSGPLQVLPGLA